MGFGEFILPGRSKNSTVVFSTHLHIDLEKLFRIRLTDLPQVGGRIKVSERLHKLRNPLRPNTRIVVDEQIPINAQVAIAACVGGKENSPDMATQPVFAAPHPYSALNQKPSR